jgi:hypothetical protein
MLVHRVFKAKLDHKDHRVKLGRREYREKPAPRVKQAHKVFKGSRGHKEK